MRGDNELDPGPSTSMDPAAPEAPPLDTNHRADVCVIGAGVAGLTTAYLLGREGRKVLLLDHDPIGGDRTPRATAHLGNVLDDGYETIERTHGKNGARLAAESRTAAIRRVASILHDERIEAGFEPLDGYLFLQPGASPQRLQRELEAARRAGLEVDPVRRAPLSGWDTGPSLRFRGQAQLDSGRYLAGLAGAIARDGGQIRGAKVTDVSGGPPARVRTERGFVVVAEAVVVATDTPVHDRFAPSTGRAGSRTYAIAASVPPGSVAKAVYRDTGDPSRTARLQTMESMEADGRRSRRELLLCDEVSGTGADEARPRFDRLEAWARERFPMIEAVLFRWSGPARAPMDPGFIGRTLDPGNVYVAAGHSGMEVTHGAIAGMLLTDLVQGRRNRWVSLYSPRKPGAVEEFLQDNLNVARGYFDSLRGRPGPSLPVACPELGCQVNWNDADDTWDCPGHGSRFDSRGRVICGPSHQDLEPIGETQRKVAGARAGRQAPRRMSYAVPTIQLKGEPA